MKYLSKALVLLLTLAALASLVGCESAPIKSTEQATQSVGRVADFEVPYEEFYFLVNNYTNQLKAKYAVDALTESAHIDELRELVYENIVSNYSVLYLAERQGLSMDTEEIKEAIQQKLDLYITENFDGDRGDYKDSMEEIGITDSYVRFSFGVDILYSKLVTKYLDLGIVDDSDEYVRQHIKENFIRTWHVMIVNDDGGTESLARAQEVLARLEAGEKMYKMIGQYSEDFKMTTEDGYYFTHGIMDERYEREAYELEVDGTSGIVTAKGEDGYGNSVECYYIIERLPLEEQYIEKNYKTLKEYYYTSAIFEMVNEVKESLDFIPNDYGASLDITSLEEPKTVDFVVVNTVVAVVSAVLIAVMVSVVFIVRIKRKNADILSKKTDNPVEKK